MKNNNKSMSFLEHLEEFRWCLLRCLIGIIIGMIICYFFSSQLLYIFTRIVPDGVNLRTLRPTESFVTRLKISVTSGIILTLPYLLSQIWRFVVPGLVAQERKYFIPFLVWGVLAFIVGVVFSYFIVIPIALKFLHSFQTQNIVDAWSLGEYVSFVTRMIIVFGVIFELPIVVFILSKLGVVTPDFLAAKRKYAISSIFIIAAFLTPPDIFTQLIMVLPLVLLYEISIGISKFATKH